VTLAEICAQHGMLAVETDDGAVWLFKPTTEPAHPRATATYVAECVMTAERSQQLRRLANEQ